MPVTLSAVGAGAGVIQSLIGGSQERKAQNALEALQTPTYTPSSTIQDYYNKALARYNVNPYDSPLYKMQAQNAERSTGAGITALQGTRNVLGGISNLAQVQNDAMLKAGVTAEQQQAQQLGQLGTAAGAETNEQDKAFKYNQLAPYEKQYNLLSMKAGGGAQILNAGLSNIFNGLGAGSNAMLAQSIYGQGGGGASGGGAQIPLNGAVQGTYGGAPGYGGLLPSGAPNI